MKRSSFVLISLMLLAALPCASIALTQEKDLPPSLSSLVEAERAFARTSVEKGLRDSFLAFFAEDGIWFTPHPSNTRQELLKQPAPSAPRATTLNWRPVYADVSRAGDLGYTTGPYLVTDRSPQQKPLRHGYYFSIWKKQADGNWKVVVDLGIQTPAPPSEPQSFRAARPTQTIGGDGGGSSVEKNRAALLNHEREFLKASQADGLAKAFLSYMSDDARLHRNGISPLTGKDAIGSFLNGKAMTLTWEPIKSDVSRSGDLGYVYGSYEQRAEGTPAVSTEKGYYVRVWKRDASGRWKVVLDTTSPIPPEK